MFTNHLIVCRIVSEQNFFFLQHSLCHDYHFTYSWNIYVLRCLMSESTQALNTTHTFIRILVYLYLICISHFYEQYTFHLVFHRTYAYLLFTIIKLVWIFNQFRVIGTQLSYFSSFTFDCNFICSQATSPHQCEFSLLFPSNFCHFLCRVFRNLLFRQ